MVMVLQQSTQIYVYILYTILNPIIIITYSQFAYVHNSLYSYKQVNNIIIFIINYTNQNIIITSFQI